jgi:hypothetical protein
VFHRTQPLSFPAPEPCVGHKKRSFPTWHSWKFEQALISQASLLTPNFIRYWQWSTHSSMKHSWFGQLLSKPVKLLDIGSSVMMYNSYYPNYNFMLHFSFA